jgi:Xaa-Pro dipeptidase
MGRIKTLAEWKDMYQVDNVLYTNELESYLKTHIASSSSDGSDHEEQCNTKILLMKGRNTDSGSMYEPPKLFDKDNEGDEKIMTKYIDDEILFPILAECRVIKSDDELALLEYVSQVSSFAHAYVMRNVFKTAATVAAPAGTTAASTTLTSSPVEYEYQCESLFRHYAYFNYGCRLVSYTSICGCGPNSAILHYGHAGEPNSRKINYVGQDHVLFDMGAEYMCYASDITVSFPVNGTFSSKYRPVYESVLDAQRAVIAMIRPGVSWVDCHKAAEIEILKGLYKIGIIQIPSGDGEVDDDEDASGKGTDVVSILQDLNERHRFGAVFMPHGLGHFLGIDTHDVGGYLPGHPERSPLPGLKSLRTARTLKERMVLTVEPGCYFIDHLLDGAMDDPILSKYLNHDLINTEYRGYGGVRLEDVVTVVTPSASEDNRNKFVPGSGCINFTLCPRTVEEVEHVMAGGKWPPLKDAAPELRRVRLASPISPLPPPPSF